MTYLSAIVYTALLSIPAALLLVTARNILRARPDAYESHLNDLVKVKPRRQPDF